LVKVLLKFSEEVTDQPITSQVIKEKNVTINILSAHVDQQGGEMLVEIPQEEAEGVIEAFRSKGVTVELRKLIEVDKKKCFDCGGCIALCPVDVMSYDEDNVVVFDEERCLGSTCALCIDACPVRAIKLIT
jgi:NAD-dependent dihydropyrimidine dehydrogenase PreA subunit